MAILKYSNGKSTIKGDISNPENKKTITSLYTSGELTAEDFSRSGIEPPKNEVTNEIRFSDLLKKYDTNKNSMVDPKDSIANIDEVISKYDVNNDGVINNYDDANSDMNFSPNEDREYYLAQKKARDADIKAAQDLINRLVKSGILPSEETIRKQQEEERAQQQTDDLGRVYSFLLKGFDSNGNHKLDPQELERAKAYLSNKGK